VEDMATTKKKSEALGKQIGVRLTPKDYARLDKLAAHVSISDVARRALLLGLGLLEDDPGLLVRDDPKKR
jgi:hypothetical protein